MAFLSHSKKEIKAKIVYYGPGLSGKTSNIEFIHAKMRSDHRGELVNLSTSDRTLFFDFLPVELGNIKGYRTRFHIFTVPGQVFYNETRRTVLQDVDGIVFVADSQKKMRDDNLRSLKNLEENLASYGKKLQDIPHVFQYNKRDLPDALSIEDLHRQLNKTNAPFFEAVATGGNGVLNTLKLISKMVLKKLATSTTEAIEESDEAFEEKNYGLGQEYVVVTPGTEVEDQEAVVHTMELDIPSGEVVMEGTPVSEEPAAAEVVEEANIAEQPAAAAVKVAEKIDEPHKAEEAHESYEAEIHNELDESEIPPPPPHVEPAAEFASNPNPAPDAVPAEAATPAASIVEQGPEPATVAEDESPQMAAPEPEPIPMAEPEPAPAPEHEPIPMAEPEPAPTPLSVAPSPPPPPSPMKVQLPPAGPTMTVDMTKPTGVKELVLYQWGFPERVGPSAIKIPIYFRDPQTQEEYWSYITLSLDNIFKRL